MAACWHQHGLTFHVGGGVEVCVCVMCSRNSRTTGGIMQQLRRCSGRQRAAEQQQGRRRRRAVREGRETVASHRAWVVRTAGYKRASSAGGIASGPPLPSLACSPAGQGLLVPVTSPFQGPAFCATRHAQCDIVSPQLAATPSRGAAAGTLDTV